MNKQNRLVNSRQLALRCSCQTYVLAACLFLSYTSNSFYAIDLVELGQLCILEDISKLFILPIFEFLNLENFVYVICKLALMRILKFEQSSSFKCSEFGTNTEYQNNHIGHLGSFGLCSEFHQHQITNFLTTARSR